MMRSANEIAGLVLKAARGAGLDVGLAEDLARASGWLDESALNDLAARLGDDEARAALISANLALDEVQASAAAEMPLDVIASGLAHARGIGPEAKPLGAREVGQPLWQALEIWAARTYVPATEASRLAGAGAGLTDND